MNFDVSARTILYVRHGSHAYGTNIETSDEDFKGVCVKPKAAYLGFLENFEQDEHMASKHEGVDSVTYSLDKFARLAADCNPNIIEVLHVSDRHVFKIDEFGEELRGARDLFLSKKARYTFSGYAHAQLKRIKTHRAWLLTPPPAIPMRKEFGLSENAKVTPAEFGAFEASVAQGLDLEMSQDVLTLFLREKQYRAAKTQFDQYVNWKKSRNPARAELEEKFGYDVKHGGHLRRLQKMAKEIATDHKVYVDRLERGDHEELLAIRRGDVPYEKLVEDSERDDFELDELYKSSTLRREPDRKLLDSMIVSMTERYLSKHG